jgi:hypothetical protein
MEQQVKVSDINDIFFTVIGAAGAMVIATEYMFEYPSPNPVAFAVFFFGLRQIVAIYSPRVK